MNLDYSCFKNWLFSCALISSSIVNYAQDQPKADTASALVLSKLEQCKSFIGPALLITGNNRGTGSENNLLVFRRGNCYRILDFSIYYGGILHNVIRYIDMDDPEKYWAALPFLDSLFREVPRSSHSKKLSAATNVCWYAFVQKADNKKDKELETLMEPATCLGQTGMEEMASLLAGYFYVPFMGNPNFSKWEKATLNNFCSTIFTSP